MADTNNLQNSIVITNSLINEHPIFSEKDYLLEKIFKAWEIIWETKIGNEDINFPLKDVEPRAQIIGEFFETIFSEIITNEYDTRRGSSKEKDILFNDVNYKKFDFEIKTSGQAGGKIFGNRSYAQPDINGELDSESRKGKSGFYLCLNFYKFNIYKIRIGWIDSQDWEPQASATGQMAGLKPYVYTNKLIELFDKRLLDATVRILPGVGDKSTLIDTYESINDLCNDIKNVITLNELNDFIINNRQTKTIKRLHKDIRKGIKSEYFYKLYKEFLQES